MRLPVAHCELNPIEMAWKQLKDYVKERNTRYVYIVTVAEHIAHVLYHTHSRFTLTEVQRLVNEGFQHVTPAHWSSLIKHVEETVEDQYWRHDGLYEQQVEDFRITVGGEDDESSSSASSSSDDDSCSDSDSD